MERKRQREINRFVKQIWHKAYRERGVKMCQERKSRQDVKSACQKTRRDGWNKTVIKQKRECINSTRSPVWRRGEPKNAYIYQRLLREPPGTETPVSPGNKKMIKSDLILCCCQAKTHICHSQTDATAPPSHPTHTPLHSTPVIHYTRFHPPTSVSSQSRLFMFVSLAPAFRHWDKHNLFLMFSALRFAVTATGKSQKLQTDLRQQYRVASPSPH